MPVSANKPTVSVVIPTYGEAAHLREAVESALAQSVRPAEIIVVDDASPVPGTDAVFGLDPIIRVIRLDRNGGANVARNRGIREAQGDFIAFLDDDDLWLPYKLERQLAAMAAQHAPMCLCGYRVLGSDAVQLRSVDRLGEAEIRQVRQVPGFTSAVVDAVVAKRLMLDESLPNTQDWDFYARVVREAPIAYVPEVLYEYRRDGRNTISNKVLSMSPAELDARTAAIIKHRDWIGEAIYRERAAEIYLSYIRKRRNPLAYLMHSISRVGLRASVKALARRI